MKDIQITGKITQMQKECHNTKNSKLFSNNTIKYVPGYQGFIPKINSENLQGNTFTKTAEIALSKNDCFNRFQSTNQVEFDQKENSAYSNQDYSRLVQKKTVLYENILQDPRKIKAIDRCFKSGYMGYRPVCRNPLSKFNKIKEKYETAKANKQTIEIEEVNKDKLNLPAVGYQGYVPMRCEHDFDGKNYHDSVKDILIRRLKEKSLNLP